MTYIDIQICKWKHRIKFPAIWLFTVYLQPQGTEILITNRDRKRFFKFKFQKNSNPFSSKIHWRYNINITNPTALNIWYNITCYFGCHHSVQKAWTPVSIDTLSLYGHPSLYIFRKLLTSDNIAAMICGINTNISAWVKVISFCLEDYQTSKTSIYHTRLRFESK